MPGPDMEETGGWASRERPQVDVDALDADQISGFLCDDGIYTVLSHLSPRISDPLASRTLPSPFTRINRAERILKELFRFLTPLVG